MAVTTCRVCSSEFLKEPLLKFMNMPKAAQFLPDEKSLPHDKGMDLDVYQCSGCGLVQLKNEPVSYYREVIRAAAVSPEMKEFRIKQFYEFISRFSLKGKKIFEIGCGKGEYLELMRQAGAQAYGIEYSQESVCFCRKNGLKVSKGFLESADYKIETAPFDAFFMLNFLEHLPGPNAVLKAAYNNLNEDGVGLVEVPNFDMILRNKLFSEFINDHLFYFNRETLVTTLNINGFEVLECNDIWYDYIISAVVRKRKHLDISDFYDYQKNLKKEILAYIDGFDDMKVAVWGAGHQALAVISLLGLKDKVKYVVDSASFKQGKYTPATHIPIVAPDNLNKDPVEAVIVMAASYSDEVAKIIRKDFGKQIKVAILRDFDLEEIE